MKESQFRQALSKVFEKVGVQESCSQVSKKQCLEFVKLVAMPKPTAEPQESKTPSLKQAIDTKKKRAEERRKEEALENQIHSKAFEYYFYELLDFQVYDLDGKPNEYVDRAKLENLVIERAKQQGITFLN